MSAESRPITSEQFALAIQDLPVENLYFKAQEIRNSIAHLERSNQQLQEYSDSIRSDTSLPADARQEGDKDCLEAIQENETVIQRQRDRIERLKGEVERRGGRWHEAGENEATNGTSEGSTTNGTAAASNIGVRLTDEELMRQVMQRMGERDDDGDGMHL